MPPCQTSGTLVGNTEAAVQGPDKSGALAGCETLTGDADNLPEPAPVEGAKTTTMVLPGDAEKLEPEGVKGPEKSGALLGGADNGALLGDAAPVSLDALLSLARGGGEATVTEEASSTATAILDLLRRPNTVDFQKLLQAAKGAQTHPAGEVAASSAMPSPLFGNPALPSPQQQSRQVSPTQASHQRQAILIRTSCRQRPARPCQASLLIKRPICPTKASPKLGLFRLQPLLQLCQPPRSWRKRPGLPCLPPQAHLPGELLALPAWSRQPSC